MAIETDNFAEVLPPELAAWMDEGIFSRWVLEAISAVPRLLPVVSGSLTREALRRTRRVLQDTGVLVA